jgi:hypothetical protein
VSSSCLRRHLRKSSPGNTLWNISGPCLSLIARSVRKTTINTLTTTTCPAALLHPTFPKARHIPTPARSKDVFEPSSSCGKKTCLRIKMHCLHHKPTVNNVGQKDHLKQHGRGAKYAQQSSGFRVMWSTKVSPWLRYTARWWMNWSVRELDRSDESVRIGRNCRVLRLGPRPHSHTRITGPFP